MGESLKRTIVRRAGMSLAVIALQFILYVGGFLATSYANGAGRISRGTASAVGLAYLPFGFYIQSELPGSSALDDASRWAFEKGAESTQK